MLCYLFPEPSYFLYSSDVPALLYYAYIPITIIMFICGLYIFFNGKKLLLNRLFLALSLSFLFWALSVLIEWTNIHSSLILFIWSFQGIIWSLIAIFSIYFIYVFLEKKDVSTRIKVIFLALLAPVFLLSPTNFNLSGFNITNCDAFKFEWFPFKIYYTFLGILAMVWICILLIRKYRTSISDFRKQIVLMGTGIEIFLFLFFVWTSLVYYLTQIGILQDSSLEMIGLIGTVIFIIYVSILMVRFNVFNIKLLATQALVWGLIALIGAQFFFISGTTNLILNSITFIGVIVFGQFLIDSVKREVEQRERLETLRLKLEESNLNLGVANDKLKDLDKLKTEFVSLASHQLRSPLTAIKGYTSMLLEGDYGDIDPKAKETIERVMESSNNLTMVVEDLLNVTKIEAGGMKYEMASFELSQVVSDEAKDLSMTAEKKGLKLNFESDEKNLCVVNGDKEKIRQVIINFIDNSIKYTKEGSINVSVKNKEGKVIFAVKDTGMGMTQETKDSLFQKFARGDGARMNTTGTGLGLYLAKQIVEAHKGRVWVESDGVGKGSQFYMELDAVSN